MEETKVPEKEAQSEMFTMRFPPSLKARLEERAKSEHRSLANLILHVVSKYLRNEIEVDPIAQEEARTFERALQREEVAKWLSAPPPMVDIKDLRDGGTDSVKHEHMPWVQDMPSKCPKCGSKSLLDNQIPQTWACNDCFAEGAYGEKNKPQ